MNEKYKICQEVKVTHCDCAECDFNENLKCSRSSICIGKDEFNEFMIDKNNSNQATVDEDGCFIFYDKWDEIESRDKTD